MTTVAIESLCPFCKAGIEMTRPTVGPSRSGSRYVAIQCGVCGARGPMIQWPVLKNSTSETQRQQHADKAFDEATRKWNDWVKA